MSGQSAWSKPGAHVEHDFIDVAQVPISGIDHAVARQGVGAHQVRARAAVEVGGGGEAEAVSLFM